jgi:hypothetical protein
MGAAGMFVKKIGKHFPIFLTNILSFFDKHFEPLQ